VEGENGSLVREFPDEQVMLVIAGKISRASPECFILPQSASGANVRNASTGWRSRITKYAMQISGLRIACEQADELRRSQGRLLDWLGLGPIETPSRIVYAAHGVRLRAFADDAQSGPVLLIVPAPIKRAYIWDLLPWASVVRQCLRNGIRPFLVEWIEPGAEEQDFGLADYADRLLGACLDAVEAEAGEPCACLAGHSLGGTLAAIFAALYPERVPALVLLETPLHFGPDAGAFAPLVAAVPRIGAIREQFGSIPGCFLNTVSVMAAPTEFQWSRWIDAMASLHEASLQDTRALQTHMRVERWALDELALPGRLFEETVERLYREDRFMAGTLIVGARPAAPQRLTMPIISVVDPRSPIVPPCSVLPFLERIASRDTRLLWYEGDKGVALQHVGALVGRTAHRRLWPEILTWVRERSLAAG
jgi:polyhydroxyalkanoate synthase subunit PhaC